MNFIITCIDAKGKKGYDKSTKIEVLIKDINNFNSSLKQSQIQDKGDGTYILDYLVGKDDSMIVFKVNDVEIGKYFSSKTCIDVSKTVVHLPELIEIGRKTEISFSTKSSKDTLFYEPNLKIDITIECGKDQIPFDISKKEDGIYFIDFLPQEGEMFVHIKLNEHPVPKSPFKIIALSIPDPLKSTADGPGLFDTLENVETNFKISIRNQYGIPLKDQASNIGINFDPMVNYTLIDQKNGTYDVKYVPTIFGPLSISVLVNGTSISKSPYKIHVISQDVCDPTKTLIDDTSRYSFEAFSNCQFRITSKGKDGSIRNGKYDEFTVFIKHLDSDTEIDSNILNNENGTYDVTFVPKKSGQHQVQVFYQGTKISSSPFIININTPQWVVYGPGLKDGVQALKKTYFFVEKRSDVQEKIKDFKCGIEAPKKSGSCDTKITNPDSGRMKIEYTPKDVGIHSFSIIMNNQEIPGSPFKVNVSEYIKPKSAPQKSYAQGISSTYKIGNEARFLVYVVDEDSQIIENGNENIQVKITGKEEIESQIINNGDGSYTITFLLASEEEYSIDIRVDGIPIMNSPFLTEGVLTEVSECWEIAPNQKFFNTLCPVIVSPVEKSSIVEPNSVHIELVNGPSDNDVFVQKLLKDKDSYIIQIFPTTIGQHSLSILFDGKDIKNSPFTFDVKESCDPNNILIQNLKKKIDAFVPSKFTIVSKDRDGLIRKGEDDDFIVKIRGPEEDTFIGETNGILESKIKNNKDGTYDVEYLPKVAGTYELNISIYGQVFFNETIQIISPEWYAHGRGLKNNIPAGKMTSFVIERIGTSEKVKDFKCGITAPKKSKNCDMKVSSDTPGIIKVEYLPKEPGEHIFSILVNNKEIKGNPFIVNVKPTGANKEKCFISNFNNDIRVGEYARLFTINSIDNEGNIRKNEEDDFMVLIEEPEKNLIRALIVNNHDGTYDAFFTPRFEGECFVEILLDGVGIENSPFSFYSNPPIWQFKDEDLSFVEGRKSNILLLENVKDIEEKKLNVIFQSPNNNIQEANVNYLGKNTYEIEFLPEIYGEYSMIIKVDDEEIPTSPYSIEISPRCDPSKSYIEIPKETNIHEDLIQFKVISNDSSGQLRVGYEDNILVDVNPLPIKCLIENDKKGIYNVEIVPSQNGEQTISVKIDNQETKGSPFIIKIEKTEEDIKRIEKKKNEETFVKSTQKLDRLFQKKKDYEMDILTYEERAKKILNWITSTEKRFVIRSAADFGQSYISCLDSIKIFNNYEKETCIMRKEKGSLYFLFESIVKKQKALSIKPYIPPNDVSINVIIDEWNKLEKKQEEYGKALTQRFITMKRLEIEILKYKSFLVEYEEFLKEGKPLNQNMNSLDMIQKQMKSHTLYKQTLKSISSQLDHFIAVSKELDLEIHKDAQEMKQKTNEIKKKLTSIKENTEKKSKDLEKMISHRKKIEDDLLKYSESLNQIDALFEEINFFITDSQNKNIEENFEKYTKLKEMINQLTPMYKNLSVIGEDLMKYCPISYENVYFKIENFEELLKQKEKVIHQQQSKENKEYELLKDFEAKFNEYKEWVESQIEYLNENYNKDSEHEILLTKLEDDIIQKLEENSTKYKQMRELYTKILNEKLHTKTQITIRSIEEYDHYLKDKILFIEENLQFGLERCEQLLMDTDISCQDFEEWIQSKQNFLNQMDISSLLSINNISLIESYLKSYKSFEINFGEQKVIKFQELSQKIIGYKHKSSEELNKRIVFCTDLFNKLKHDLLKLIKDLEQLHQIVVSIENDSNEYALKVSFIYEKLDKYLIYLKNVKKYFIEYCTLEEYKILLEEHLNIQKEYPKDTIKQVQVIWDKIENAGEDPCVYTQINIQMIIKLDHQVKTNLENNIQKIEKEIQRIKKENEIIQMYESICLDYIKNLKMTELESEEKKKAIFALYDVLNHNKLVDKVTIDKTNIQNIYQEMKERIIKEYPIFKSYDVNHLNYLTKDQILRAANELEKVWDSKSEQSTFEEFISGLRDTTPEDLKRIFEILGRGQKLMKEQDLKLVREEIISKMKKKEGGYDYQSFIDEFFNP